MHSVLCLLRTWYVSLYPERGLKKCISAFSVFLLSDLLRVQFSFVYVSTGAAVILQNLICDVGSVNSRAILRDCKKVRLDKIGYNKHFKFLK
jgi:hypothetical protein